MSDPFLGQIVMFAGNFAPRGWAKCEGQLLPISANSALFSLLGTMYGGDGRTTFGLPDLRGRVPIHPGNGPGLSAYKQGQKGGAERVTLTTAQLPAHTHAVISKSATNPPTPEGDVGVLVGKGAAASTQSAATGGGQAFNVVQPYQSVQFIIALQGVYPSRS